MKICYINPTQVLRRPLVELAGLMSKKGHKVTLIYPKDILRKSEQFHYDKLLDGVNLIPIKTFDLPFIRNPLPNPITLFKEIKKALEENDIVHYWEYYYFNSIAPVILKKFGRYKAKIIFTTDGFVGYTYKPKILSTVFRIYTKIFRNFLFYTPDKITFYSNNLINDAKEIGLPIRNSVVIPTGINLKKFRNIKSNTRKEFDIKKDEILITCIGMLTNRKRPWIFINSIKELKEKYNIRALLIGHGPLEKECKRLCKGIKEITIIGNRKDVPEILSTSDIVFMPGIGEGLPGVVMEAAASAKPVIASNEGGTSDILIHNKTGFLSNNEEEFKRYLEILIKDKKLRNKMGKEALRRIKKFDWNVVLKKYEVLYNNLLRGKDGNPN
ncbi:MAG: glycosyltransferase family 4 protein [Candidatus Woesearchaeota archaeon]|nr:MAG: glycosyltransferase family 4 protein [Candidatus Woesearchaeota archaeon]